MSSVKETWNTLSCVEIPDKVNGGNGCEDRKKTILLAIDMAEDTPLGKENLHAGCHVDLFLRRFERA